LAHVGVLRVLERAGVHFSVVTGTSIGSLVGAMYTQLGSADRVEEKFRRFLDSETYRKVRLDRLDPRRTEHDFLGHVMETIRERLVINLALSRRSLVNGEEVGGILQELIEPGRIEHLPVRFAAVAVDLLSGDEAIITRGDILRAVQASGSLPGFFPPCEVDDRLLVDGAVRATLPVNAARFLGAQFVVAVDVSQDLDPEPELDHIVDIIARCYSITSDAHRQCLRERADFVIRPEVGQVHWTRFDLLDDLVRRGERAAAAALPELQKRLERLLPLFERLKRKLHVVR